MVSRCCCSRFHRPTIDAAIAGAFTLFVTWTNGCLYGFGLLTSAWLACIGDTGNDRTIADVSLDEPVVIAVTRNARIEASSAQVEVALLTDATMEVFVRNRLATVIAVDAECACREVVE